MTKEVKRCIVMTSEKESVEGREKVGLGDVTESKFRMWGSG